MTKTDKRIQNVLEKYGILFGIDTFDKCGFEDTDIDLTNEPITNYRFMWFFPDSVQRGEDDFSDCTTAISYPNDKAIMEKALAELKSINKNLFVALTIEELLNDDNWNSRIADTTILRGIC